MMAAYQPPHSNQLQHAVTQASQQIQPGHAGQPTPHAMQHLHPTQAFQQHQQQMQAMNSMTPHQTAIINNRIRQQHFLNGLSVNGIGGANPGVSGNPSNPGMGAFAGGPPHIRGQMLPPQLQQVRQIQQAQQAQIQQQQQQLAAQQLALAGQVNVQAGQNMSMAPQQVNLPANAVTAGQQVNLAHVVARAQQQGRSSGQAVLKMHHFNNMLSQFEKDKQPNDILYWRQFVIDFFSQNGVMRQMLLNTNTRETKNFEIGNAILARYFWELIESGVYSIQFQLEGLREKELANGQGMVVECLRAGITYTFKDAVCFHHGYLRATLNSHLQIDLLEFNVLEHQEFVSRSSLQPLPNQSDASDEKSSPRSKQLGKRAMPQAQQPQVVAMPEPNVNPFGLSPIVLRFLEAAETMSTMTDLMMFSRNNPQYSPRAALNALVAHLQQAQQQQIRHQQMQHMQHMQMQQMQHMQQLQAVANAQAMQNPPQGHPGAPGAGAGGPQMHQNMNMVPGMASPATGEGRLVPPSPHIGQTPPANQIQAPGQQPQQHPISNSSSQNSTTVGSANTSPNQPNKRRRPSTSQNVKNEDEDTNEPKSGQNMAVKPSPRMANNKRIKTANHS